MKGLVFQALSGYLFSDGSRVVRPALGASGRGDGGKVQSLAALTLDIDMLRTLAVNIIELPPCRMPCSSGPARLQKGMIAASAEPVMRYMEHLRLVHLDYVIWAGCAMLL